MSLTDKILYFPSQVHIVFLSTFWNKCQGTNSESMSEHHFVDYIKCVVSLSDGSLGYDAHIWSGIGNFICSNLFFWSTAVANLKSIFV